MIESKQLAEVQDRVLEERSLAIVEEAKAITITDQATGLMWTKHDSAAPMNWLDALAHAENLQLAGHGDWRLPNVKELQSLIHYGVHDPALPDTSGMGQWSEGDPFTGVLCAVTGCAFGRYWSSTTTAGSPASGMFVYLGGGWVERTAKDADFSVWPVRGGN